MVEENNDAPKGEEGNTEEVQEITPVSVDDASVQNANVDGITIRLKGKEYRLNPEEVATKLKMSAEQVVTMAKENPNTFVATIVAGPFGWLIGRQLDNREKKNS
jgi:hypothetical protein